MTRVKEFGLVLLTAAVIFFAVQNYDTQGSVAFLWWDFSVPISLITLVPLLVGLLVGAGTAVVIGHRKGKRMRELKSGAAEEMAPEEPTDADEEDDARLLAEAGRMQGSADDEERAGSERAQ